MTLEIDGCHPIQINKRVPIQLGRTLEGKPMVSLFLDPGTQDEGAMEVALHLSAVESLAPLCTQLSVSTTSLAPSGRVIVSETCVQPLPKSRAYTQLELMEAKYKSGS
jgi:hypothetical protein